jgi:hypothetical protein
MSNVVEFKPTLSGANQLLVTAAEMNLKEIVLFGIDKDGDLQMMHTECDDVFRMVGMMDVGKYMFMTREEE